MPPAFADSSSAPPTQRTLGQLVQAGYRQRGVREELRDNLLYRLRRREPLFPGMHGYDETVIPAIVNALIAGQDLLFLGERGQGKTRLIRGLCELLDPWLPVIDGSEVNDDPFAPISRHGKALLAEHGDATPIRWIGRDDRYGEKLATPDVSTADLIGDVDPMKVVQGRSLGDELTIHFGLLPRTNRGIFCINELPDLTEKIQVALFNVMQERDVQIKGYRVRLPLDVLLVASANPEDYTSRGRIVTPLKDRYAAQIRTHYPQSREVEAAIVDQEATVPQIEGVAVHVPEHMRRLIVELTFQARQSPEVSQGSGVSVRTSIANHETLVANAVRRALACGDAEAVPRISDLGAIVTSTQGKLELEYAVNHKSEHEVINGLIRRATKVVFDELFRDAALLDSVVHAFDRGWMVEVGELTAPREFLTGMEKIPGLKEAIAVLAPGESAPRLASAIELVLEGLHLCNRLNKTVEPRRGAVYGRL